MLTITLLATLIVSNSSRVRAIPADSLHPEPVILNVGIGSVASTTVTALRIGARALLPLADVLALAELPAMADSNAFVSTDSLSSLMHVSITVDWEELTATISDDGTLPVSRHAARDRRRAELDAIRASSITQASATPIGPPMLPHDLVLDYEASVLTDPHSRQPSMRLELGTSLLAGGVDVDFVRIGHFSQTTIGWRGSWPDLPPLRDVHIGMVQVTDMVPAAGISISSESPTGDENPDSIFLSGNAAPGWQVEVFRNEMLIDAGLTDAAGNYRVSVPVFRGVNRLTVSSFGPRGEQRVSSRYVSIGESMIRRGTGTYDLAVGRCTGALCQYAAQLTARYAPFGNVTVGGGLVDLYTAGEHHVDPSWLVAARLRDDVNASIHFSDRGITSQMQYAPAAAFDVTAAYQTTNPPPESANGTPARQTARIAAVWRPDGLSPISATFDYAGPPGGGSQRRLRIASPVSLGRAYIRPFATLSATRRSRSTKLRFGAYAESTIPLLVPGIRMRVMFDDPFSGARSLLATFPIARLAQLDAGVAWIPDRRMPELTASVHMMTHAMRYDAQAVASGPSTSTTQSVSGSVWLTKSRATYSTSVGLSATQSRGRAEVVGTVFVDDDGNGLRDESEELLPGVSVTIGQVTVETDSAGAYRAYDLMPFAPVVVTVDQVTLPDPATRVGAFRVIPLPNAATRVDLAVERDPSGASVPAFSSTVDRIPQHSESRDAPAIHGDNLESRAADPDSIAHARQPAKASEDVTTQGRPVPVGDVEVIV